SRRKFCVEPSLAAPLTAREETSQTVTKLARGMRAATQGLVALPSAGLWETTRASSSRGRHCNPDPSDAAPRELSTQEASDFLRRLTEFGRPFPTVVFTGADPLMRGDLFALAELAGKLGISVALFASVTPAWGPEAAVRIADSGIRVVSISI